MKNNSIHIGTRGSQLALYQANKVKEILETRFADLTVELVIIKTKGDKILDVALSKIGDKGLFTKELEVALANGTIDLAVHSLKDMPTQLPTGMMLAAVLERADVRDAFVSKNGLKMHELTADHVVATSSLRRIANLKHTNPEVQIVDIRGNINTRLQKMQNGHCDAMIMAAAGLQRLGMDELITEFLPPEQMLPAVGQGAIGIEIANDRPDMEKLLTQINHAETWEAVVAERTFMNSLQGGCQVPIGCYTTRTNNELSIQGFVASVDGKTYLSSTVKGDAGVGRKLGIDLAKALLDQGAAEILAAIRH